MRSCIEPVRIVINRNVVMLSLFWETVNMLNFLTPEISYIYWILDILIRNPIKII
jgi:hypothetical protein